MNKTINKKQEDEEEVGKAGKRSKQRSECKKWNANIHVGRHKSGERRTS